MMMIKYATPILALLLTACGGDEGNTDAVVATPSTSSSIAQVLLNQYSSNEVNLNTVLQSETLYSDSVQISSNANGKQEASIDRYNTISIKDKTVQEEQFYFDSKTQQWLNAPVKYSEALYLTDGKWEKPGKAKAIAKGNDIILDYGNDIQFLISGTSKDISNIAVMDVNLNKSNTQTGSDYSLFKTPAPAFPAGSKAYYVGYSPLKTTYRSQYSNAVSFKSIDEWAAFYSTTSKNTLDSNSLCSFQFDLTRKTVIFSNNPNASQKCTAKEQPYEIRTIKQQQLLVMTPAQTDNSSLLRKEFYAISNGNLLEGEVLEPFEPANGTVSASGDFSLEVRFNKTAINHLLKYGGLSAPAQLK
ncbi:hypothetical protein HA050_08715 [Iodobacter sp. HSC-16F04]|uniref:Lipoprotein n=1 Tax=Iodobacter violaceini TaxID=3044271 RepID=A0ABX0KQU8_9NEIS|nr:hypothetical protein [Iodobacter violacea]NHQ86196.1 hypothetical protein [Iodobacter violacea]